jgi:hypothetical protein
VSNLQPTEFEKLQLAREQLSKEIQYRRDREWQIFSWASSVLIAIIGGSAALSGVGRGITYGHKLWLAGGVAALTFWACIWFFIHSRQERQRGLEANCLDNTLSLFSDPLYFSKGSRLWWLVRGDIFALIFLGGAAVFAIIRILPDQSG